MFIDKNVYERIAYIAEKIKSTGKNPTLGEIKKALHKFDLNDNIIRKVLQLWKKNQKPAALPFKTKSELDQYIDIRLAREVAKRTRELKRSMALLRATLDSTTDAILIINNEGKLIDWNINFETYFPKEIFQHRDESMGLRYLLTIMEEPEELYKLILYLYDHPEVGGDMGDVRFTDGRIIERYTQPHIVDNTIVGRVWSFRDVTVRRLAEEALRLRMRALESCTHGIIITKSYELGYPIVYTNAAFLRITGYEKDEVMGRNAEFLQNNDRSQAQLINLRLALREQRQVRSILRNYRKDGSLFWNELRIAPIPDASGSITHFVGIIEDVTQRKSMEDQLLFQATHDALTKLPNRSLLMDRISQSIQQAQRQQGMMALLFLDVDYFKLINESLGHHLGDDLLKAAAKRLQRAIRDPDTVARMGGDEFIILLNGIKNYQGISEITEKILSILAQTYYIENQELNITVSLGISFYPKDATDAEGLIKCADMSMYQAKESGRNCAQYFTEELNKRVAKRLYLENGLRRAIEKNQLCLFYQPIIRGKDKQWVGMEALLRWRHPQLGIVSPDEFITLAEETGIIKQIGQWVLRTACNDCKKLQEKGHPNLFVAVNLSVKQLMQASIVDETKKILEASRLAPEYLELEITESVLMEHNELVMTILAELKALNVKLVIDDFGTGYSNLSYLKQFPLDLLKIDHSFMEEIDTKESNRSLLSAIISMAKNLGLLVVAEGVETKSQFEFLKRQGCDYFQGYYFAKPMPLTELVSLPPFKISKN